MFAKLLPAAPFGRFSRSVLLFKLVEDAALDLSHGTNPTTIITHTRTHTRAPHMLNQFTQGEILWHGNQIDLIRLDCSHRTPNRTRNQLIRTGLLIIWEWMSHARKSICARPPIIMKHDLNVWFGYIRQHMQYKSADAYTRAHTERG